jgi:hypothetical protein
VYLKSTSKPPQHKSQDKILAKRIVRIAARIFGLGKKTQYTENEKSTNPLIINPLLHEQHPKSAKLPKHPRAEENDDDDHDDDEEAAEEGKKDKKKQKTKRQKKLRLFTLLLPSKNQDRQMRNKKQN